MASGDRVTPADDTNVAQTNLPPLVLNSTTSLRKASEFLFENSRIGPLRSHYDKYRRYIHLRSDQMFTALVSLYANVFHSQWFDFRRFHESFGVPQHQLGWTHAARVYISMWFIDLYVSNREAVKKISSIAFNERFGTEITFVSNEYDVYLALLNASIRPTHISLALEDSLYIPVISDVIDFTNPDPFDIPNFVKDEEYFYGLLDIMKARRHWNFQPLSHNVLGRPCWLFDWHQQATVCSWFPMEGHFNNEDVTLAYILGEACTPNLGPRDVDDWQFFDGQIPADLNPAHFDRITDRRFYGSYEVRTLEVDSEFTLPTTAQEAHASAQKKRKSGKEIEPHRTVRVQPRRTTRSDEPQGPPANNDATATSSTDVVEAPRYRLEDWCYHYRVILFMDPHTRTGALRMLSHNN
uniref:Putative CP n=1 Tax=Dactylorhiza cryptic virus 3 TaxID=2809265 RepID=A0A890CBP5_9VIRU|nr:putative CP [Dactylorhiza cryptic virus 3]